MLSFAFVYFIMRVTFLPIETSVVISLGENRGRKISEEHGYSIHKPPRSGDIVPEVLGATARVHEFLITSLQRQNTATLTVIPPPSRMLQFLAIAPLFHS
jgi:hypothetical protein